MNNFVQVGGGVSGSQPQEATGVSTPAPVASPSRPWKIAWVRERALDLHDLFQRMERAIASGECANQLQFVRRFCKRYRKTRHYRSKPSIKMRLSVVTVWRELYRWRAGGRCPEALLLKYRTKWDGLGTEEIQTFLRMCLASQTVSFAGARRAMPGFTASASSLTHGLPSLVRFELKRLFRARRAALREQAEANAERTKREEEFRAKAQKTLARFESDTRAKLSALGVKG